MRLAIKVTGNSNERNVATFTKRGNGVDRGTKGTLLWPMHKLLPTILLSLLACNDPVDIRRCNGAVELCERPLNGVTFAAAHNAMSNHDEGWSAPNHWHGIKRQLNDGVRALLLDIYDDDGVPHLCHGVCWAGQEPLAEGLGKISEFMEKNTDEVVLLVLQNTIAGEHLAEAFEHAGLRPLAIEHAAGTEWPTLAALIDSGTRLLILTDHGDQAAPWLLPLTEQVRETHFQAESREDFSCALTRGSDSAQLILLNHFLTSPVAAPELADQVNFNPYFGERVARCAAAYGQQPNLIAVDFYSAGDLMSVVDAANGVTRGAPN
jgi:hypothetical protein